MKFFRFFLSFSLIALFIHVLGACESDEVVNCFSSVIGKWLESLWHSSKDIEILTWETCEYQAIMQKCVALDSCTRLEIHEIAAKLTDILYQRSNSGSFLSSFYTLQFICSAEGQTILQSKLRCLQEFHMNREILISSQKIHTRLLDSKESKQKRDWRLDNCEILKTEADQFDFGSSRKCGETAGYFVCKSFAVQFLQLYPESFENCHVCIDLETFQSDQEAEEFEYSDFPTGNLSALTKFEDANFSAAQTILQLSEVRTEKPGNRETIQERTIDLFFNTSNIDLASYRLTVILFLVLCIMA